MEIKYLTSEHLAGFENYKYSCKDTSPLSNYIMHPFWNKVVLVIPSETIIDTMVSKDNTWQNNLSGGEETFLLQLQQYCPKWVAPNLLTFLGFLFTLATFLLLSWMDYDFYASTPDRPDVPPLPKWVFMLSAINLFLAYTLDGIDGKQARRTGTSGPLGELFDHGLDSYTAALVPIIMYHIFGRSEVYSLDALRLYFILCNVLVNFYLTHWEKYNTGVLFLPWGYDFSMWCTIITFLIAGIWGHEIWQFTLPGNISAGRMFEIILYVSSMVSNLPVIMYNVYASYRYKTGYMRTFSEATRPLISMVVFFVLMIFWVVKSPLVLEKDPRALYFMTGTIFSNIACRLIVAQMSSTTCQLYNWLLFPTALTVFASLLIQHAQVDLALVYALCILATIAHVHYGTCVVRQMCSHFRINCFTIRPHSD